MDGDLRVRTDGTIRFRGPRRREPGSDEHCVVALHFCEGFMSTAEALAE
jgi:hypothetical protein